MSQLQPQGDALVHPEAHNIVIHSGVSCKSQYTIIIVQNIIDFIIVIIVFIIINYWYVAFKRLD